MTHLHFLFFFSQLQITYSGAILEVCMRKLVFYPEIVGFIEEEKQNFPTLKVEYVFNSPPKLIMLDGDDERKETIRYKLLSPPLSSTFFCSGII